MNLVASITASSTDESKLPKRSRVCPSFNFFITVPFPIPCSLSLATVSQPVRPWVVLQTQTRSACERQAVSSYIWISMAARCNSLLVSGRPGLILATRIASESEVRWTEECTSSFHLNPSSCRISCFLYVRAFLASINVCCASEFAAYTGGTGSSSSLSTDFQWWL